MPGMRMITVRLKNMIHCSIYAFIGFVFLAAVAERTSGFSIPSSEYDALSDLYADTDGQHWRWLPVGLAGNIWNFTSGSDPCANQWQGLTCDYFGQNQAHIVGLNLTSYGLSGPLPLSIGNLAYLMLLALNDNKVTGTIPTSMGASCLNLTSVDLSQNWLSGTIPGNIGSLLPLEALQLYSNTFTGKIPSTLGGSPNLRVLDLSINHLKGTISSSIWSSSRLETINLRNNKLTGPIPAIPGTAQSLLLVNLADNKLSGPIPVFPATVTSLEVFVAFHNQLSGSLTSSICGLTSLQVLYLDNNLLSGTLQDCFDQMPNLALVLLNINAFSGFIPTSFSKLDQLYSLWLQYNSFSGSVPEFAGAQNLTELALQGNLLTGTIPVTLASQKVLKEVQLQNNFLTGSIPPVDGQYGLQILELGNNLLSGCIPQSISSLSGIIVFSADTNFLSCGLDGVFNSQTQRQLASVELYDNRITGTLPDELFLLPGIETVVAQGNCITGTLPSTVCGSKALQSLVLDGLHTSSACRTALVSAAHSYILPQAFHGTVPPCIFALPNLVTLHMSGNALTGTIPGDVDIGERLANLVLSHNVFTGTVPDAIQAHNWRYLDLSYNRITGVLQSSFGVDLISSVEILGNLSFNSSQNTIILENNRLSGRVPSPILNLVDVSMLGSNRFACKVDKSDLPSHDSDKKRYQCASNAFDAPYYTYLSMLAAVAIAFALVRWYSAIHAKMEGQLAQWQLDAAQTPRNIAYVFTALTILSQMSVVCTLLIVLILAPLYIIENTSFGTYTHKYAWMVSAAYMSGVEPFAIEFALYCLLMVVLVVAAGLLIVRKDKEERSRTRSSARFSQSSASTHTVSSPLPLWKRVLVYLAFLAVNVMVVVAANLAFVYVALTQDNGTVSVAQLLLSVFKLTWNTVCTPFLIYLSTNYMSQSRAGATFVAVQVFLGLFNNIAIPCLVVAAVSPSCFYSAFDTPAPVKATVRVTACFTEPLFVDCSRSKLIASSYEPPFHYDYQCSSSFVTYYAPAFVYLGIVAGIIAPAAKIICVIMLQRAQPGTFVYRFWRRFVPRILAPLNVTHEPAAATAAAASRNSEISVDSVGIRQLSVDTVHLQAPVKNLWSNYKPYFDANNLIISVIIYLGILLTFGVVFPPLAFVMCVTIISVAWQAKMSVGRFICNVKDVGAPHLVDLIEQECRGAISLDKLRRSMFAIITFCCFFYALFLFDTLGDAVGLYHAYWVLIVMPLVPLCLYAAVAARRRWMSKTGGPKLGMSIDVDLYELSMVGMKPNSPGSDAGPPGAAGPRSGAAVVTSALHRSGDETGDDQL